MKKNYWKIIDCGDETEWEIGAAFTVFGRRKKFATCAIDWAIADGKYGKHVGGIKCLIRNKEIVHYL